MVLSPGGRFATAAIVTAFALAGLAVTLDSLFHSRHGPGLRELPFLFGGPFIGALVARAIVAESRHLHVFLVAFAALLGVFAGMTTRHWLAPFWPTLSWYDPPPWYPPVPNAVWVAAWTFAGACAATLWRRSPDQRADSRGGLVLLLLLFLLVIVLVLPS